MTSANVLRYSGVILWKDDLVLLQRRSLQVKVMSGGWGVFGGHIEGDESPIQTAVREIEEELMIRLVPKKLKELGTIELQRTNSTYITHYYSSELPVQLSDLSLREGIGFALWAKTEVPLLHLAYEDLTAVMRHFE